jgi:hypothetical protein
MGGSSSSPPRTLSVDSNEENSVSVSSQAAPIIPVATQGKVADASSKVDEDELRRIEAYYEAKIQEIEKQNVELYKTTVDHFSTAVQQVEKKYLNTSLPLVCGELQKAVKKCYLDNKSESLNCSSEVRAFEQCVEKQRQRILAK